jgi:5-methylcytosine-specific restriction endonuclease McrBC GTP-binding regulatory subunit McrB
MPEMRFWVVSPNVRNEGSGAWIDAIRKNHCVYMGYGPGETHAARGRDFHHTVKRGDIVLIARGENKSKELYFAGIVDSDVKAVTPEKDGVPDHAYARKLKGMIGQDALAGLGLDFEGAAFGGARRIPSIYELHPSKNPKDQKIASKLKTVVEEAVKMNEENARMKALVTLLGNNYNLILTGAPGTGKTYRARQLAQKLIFGDDWEPKDENNFEESEKEKFDKQFAFVQFHPSYDYTDFVEGLRPKQPDVNGNIGFELTDGTFKKFCEAARKECKYKDNGKYDETSEKFVFVIDEINRGEISKIFGELFFSIDPGYRGVAGKVLTQYVSMRAGSDDEKKFYVPENVYIIGTMNDIDRSVESFDFAMRRRFVWEEITAAESAENMGLDDKVKQTMAALNKAISEADGLNSSYHIGGAYFLKLKKYDGDFNALWQYHIEPLLREYLRGMPDAEAKLRELRKAYGGAHS